MLCANQKSFCWLVNMTIRSEFLPPPVQSDSESLLPNWWAAADDSHWQHLGVET